VSQPNPPPPPKPLDFNEEQILNQFTKMELKFINHSTP
jgi:hypothetical protein